MDDETRDIPEQHDVSISDEDTRLAEEEIAAFRERLIDIPLNDGDFSFSLNDLDEGANENIANEEAAYRTAEIDAEKEENEHDRGEKLKYHVHWATIACFWAIVAAALIVGLIFVYHLITPVSWQFLDEEKLGKIQTLVTGSGFAAIGGYLKDKL